MALVAFMISVFLAALAGCSVVSDLLAFRFLLLLVFSILFMFLVGDCSLELENDASILITFGE